ncbi:MAG: DNA/RNA nuclease SfsA [Alphaproteobacteria bacterium]|nr:DNA/RNA nuclease SfsA [Alphaproteobacteria bacterium]
MRYPEPLIEARLIKRYKRFLADVAFPDGSEGIAHCGNPGSMMGLAEPGSRIWLSPNRNPSAKLAWRWEITTQTSPDGDAAVGINTNLANRIVESAIRTGQIKPLSGYSDMRREVRYGSRNSRIDLLLEDPERSPCYVEVKSVTLRRPDGPDPKAAQFPDAKTERGAKHLAELGDIVAEGSRAVMLYLVQRSDCTHFSLADDIDPAYAKAFATAKAAGVEALCYDCIVTPEGIKLNSSVPLRV